MRRAGRSAPLVPTNPSIYAQHEGEFDALNLRIEDLQETIKRIRESFVRAVRSARVNKFGEETQELRLKPRGGDGGEELRLLPPCGDGLEECVCGAFSSPPKPVHDGSLRKAIEVATRKAAAAAPSAAAATAVAVAGGAERGRRGSDSSDHHDGGGCLAGGTFATAAEREAKRRRVRDGPGNDDVSLDEVKRQMGKSPLELERLKDVLEEEIRAASGGSSRGDRGGTAGRAKPAQGGRGRSQEPGGGGDDEGEVVGHQSYLLCLGHLSCWLSPRSRRRKVCPPPAPVVAKYDSDLVAMAVAVRLGRGAAP